MPTMMRRAVGNTKRCIEAYDIKIILSESAQLMDGDLPETDHDFRIDFILTPEEIISTYREGGRPQGMIKDHLTKEKISDIPILKEILSSNLK